MERSKLRHCHHSYERQPCVNGDYLCQWEMAIFDPPQNQHPLTDHQKIGTLQVITSGALRLCQIWCKSVHGRLPGKWVKYNEIFTYLFIPFFMNSPGQTCRRIFKLEGSNDRRGLAQGYAPFGDFVDIAPHFGGEIPRKPQFWGLNRRFQAKQAKYWKFHVIETTASISTKFCTTIETIKWSSWVVPIGAQQIQDGGRPPFWKKTVKSPYLCNRLTDFDEIWYSDAYWPLTVICR